jgi:glyoxylase-like metal-dependent hydrolase (beta-lactamase superfamily II)
MPRDREVAPGVVQVPVLGAYVWLLLGDQVTLVDTGTRGSGRAIGRALERRGRRLADLEAVVLTHYHPDHTGALPELLRLGACPRVAIHATEAPFLAAPAALPNPFRSPLLRALAQPLWPLARLRRPCPVHVPLADGDPLPGRPDARVLHLPGHTPGSIAVHLPAHGVVLAGDALERRRGRLGPPSRQFTEDPAAAWASIQRLATVEFDTLCLSHFPPLPRGAAAAVRALAEQAALPPDFSPTARERGGERSEPG